MCSPRPAGDLTDPAGGKRSPLAIDDAYLEHRVDLSRRTRCALGNRFVGNGERLGHAVHRHDAAAVALLDVAVHVGGDGCRRDEAKPSSASRGSGGRFHSIDTIAPAPAKPTAPQSCISSHDLAWTEGGQHAGPADQHRRQHRGRRAEMEQRHGSPQRVARFEFPGCGDGGRRGEQVVPCGGDRFGRPGGTGREEQRANVPRFAGGPAR